MKWRYSQGGEYDEGECDQVGDYNGRGITLRGDT